ncbi:NADPH-dependent FMN reductase [Halarcobacter ebronensis]|uniref:NADPH-dependent FMN reductase n=1 Tax=Halarcobacter ebronensis TaxID=1462615 RepID=A0A4Q1ASB0_9BACT|nr:NAD(P)H-dependent oxidoreductase [Halarcobacter ebronensis]QKF80751.1 NADPH-dependent FMN reductase [Halarcobacter ebronensis]RXK08544.1 NADPH-dependent FMN reductase [Halarcobacter ebronensis]
MVLIFVASLNENVKLAKRIEEELNSKNIETKTINLVEFNLPMFDTNKLQNGIPQKAQDLFEEMNNATGYVFVSPEYNFNVPPILVNMIAWVSRIGEDYRKTFTMKKIQLATHSGAGGQDFLNSFRNQLTKLGAVVAPREIIATYSKNVEDDSLKKVLEQYREFL